MLMGALLVVSMLAAAKEAAGYMAVSTGKVRTGTAGTEASGEGTVGAEAFGEGAADAEASGIGTVAAGDDIAAGAARGGELPCVVVDAGHGGWDPGKVGIGGTLEKDLNLEIALILKQYLEADDIRVILTRDSDEGLYDEDASNKKVQDMKRRVALIDGAHPVMAVSIHQNSYHEEPVHGAQVFYYTNSGEGRKLAELIQGELTEKADPENKRQAKSNDSYYLLKKTTAPIVIVECGFLSNGSEEERLNTKSYQDRLAWAIHMGITRYLNGQE